AGGRVDLEPGSCGVRSSAGSGARAGLHPEARAFGTGARCARGLSSPMRRLRLSLLLAGVALGVVGEWVLYGWGDPGRGVPDLAGGWSMRGCGLVGWGRGRQDRAGVLGSAAGVGGFAG